MAHPDAALSPDRTLAYVSNESGQTLSIVGLATRSRPPRASAVALASRLAS